MSSVPAAAPAQSVAAAAAPAIKKEKPLLLVDGVDPFQSKEYLDNPPKPPHWTAKLPLYNRWMAENLYIENIGEQFACYAGFAYCWPQYIQMVRSTRAFEKYIAEPDAAARRALLPRIGLGPIALRVPSRELNGMWVKRRGMAYAPLVLFGIIYMSNLFRRGHEEDFWGAGKRQLARDLLNNGKTPEQTVDMLRAYMEERRTGAKSEALYAWYDELAEIKRKKNEADGVVAAVPWWKRFF